jgi:peptidyl-tRNA hydrolase
MPRTPEEIAADRYVMYIVVRTDLKMNAGKMAAAVGHAVQMLMQWYLPDKHAGRTNKEAVLMAETGAWLEEDKPSYAKIVLGASDDEFAKVQFENEGGFLVEDRGFTEVKPGTFTCYGLYPMRKSEARGIIKTLKPLR